MSGSSRPLTSVIVGCRGRASLTRRCVVALLRHTRPPWELIAAARPGSESWAYLSGVRDASQVPVTPIETRAASQPIPAAYRAGAMKAKGELIALVRTDVVVTDAWLEQLGALLAMDGTIGMVGPMLPGTSPPQGVGLRPEAYADVAGLARFAAGWRNERRGRWQSARSLAPGCLLLRRQILERPGDLAIRVRPEGLHRRRLAARARRRGFASAVAHDLYVHRDVSGGPAIADGAATATPAEDSSPSGSRPRVSLTMIVKDEGHNLPACLDSAAGLFDEVVVVDTGSSDDTPEVARSRGARVFDFPWVDDFAQARNAALARATGDYAFWLDADDRIDPLEHAKLKTLIGRLKAGDDAAYVVRCACDDGPGGGRTVVDHIRLFPLREGVRWEYAVHEQILPSLRRAGVEVRWSDCEVRHVGYADPALRARKLVRDEAILRREAEDRPGDPFVLFNLGFIAVERRDWDAALQDLGESLRRSAPTDSIVRKLYALIARCHQGRGDSESALAACAAGLALDQDDAELLFREAVIRRGVGDMGGAEALWRRVLTLRRPERFASVDSGIYGHLTRRNLASLAAERGDHEEARSHWRAVLAECPGDAEAEANLTRRVGGEP